MDMTTGLQKPRMRPEVQRSTRWTVVLRFVTTRWPRAATRRPGRRTHGRNRDGGMPTCPRDPAWRRSDPPDQRSGSPRFRGAPGDLPASHVARDDNTPSTADRSVPIAAAWEVPPVCRSLWAFSSGSSRSGSGPGGCSGTSSARVNEDWSQHHRAAFGGSRARSHRSSPSPSVPARSASVAGSIGFTQSGETLVCTGSAQGVQPRWRRSQIAA